MVKLTSSVAVTTPPFRCSNEGWGEFDLSIDLYTAEKGGKHQILHDLNFAQPRYEAKHVITFKDPSPALMEILKKSGPVPDDANGRKAAEAKKKRKSGANIDMDKLAEMLTRLQEDDLLQVIQMIHDNKSEETYTKNDVDRKLPQRKSSRQTSYANVFARTGSNVEIEKRSPTKSPRISFKPLQPALDILPVRTRPLLKRDVTKYYYDSDTNESFLDGEFHVDLYTLPDHLVQMLWNFVLAAN